MLDKRTFRLYTIVNSVSGVNINKMNSITTSTLRDNLSETLQAVKGAKKPVLVSKRGKVVAGLLGIDQLEDLMELYDKKYTESIRKARKEIESGQVFSHDELFGEI